MQSYELIGLQGAVARGTEPTFDSQPMSKGTHLRWGFAAELGFPPGGFRLCRKIAGVNEKRIVIPREIWVGAPQAAGAVRATGARSARAAMRARRSAVRLVADVQPSVAAPSGGGARSTAGARGTAVHQPSIGQATESPPLPWTPAPNEWHARFCNLYHNVSVSGTAAKGVKRVTVEAFVHVSVSQVVITQSQVVVVRRGRFAARMRSAGFSALRLVGVATIERCECGIVAPPCHVNKDNDDDGGRSSGGGQGGGGQGGGGQGGGGQGGGSQGGGGQGGGGQGGGNGPQQGPPQWGKPDPDGWQCYSYLFRLPVTRANWPPYPNAPAPGDPQVALKDRHEMIRRLTDSGGVNLKLDAAMSTAQMNGHLDALRAGLSDLVAPYPAGPLFAAPLAPTSDGANAPTLGINLQQQVLLGALNPYMARVLGLYFVDDKTAPGVEYDYCIIGYWGGTRAAAPNVFPGAAPGAPLARGWARFAGLTISAPGAAPPQSPAPGTPAARFWRWTRDAGSPPSYQPRSDPSAPPAIQQLFAQVVGGIAPAMQPDALLALEAAIPPSPGDTTADVCHIQLARPMAQVTVQLAGSGVLAAYHAGSEIAAQSFASGALIDVTLASPDYQHQPIDEIRILASVFPIIEVVQLVVVGMLTLHLIPDDGAAAGGGIGTLYRLLHAPSPLVPLAAPMTPVNTFRHRAGELDLSNPAKPVIVARSLYDVAWDAPAPSAPSNPDDPMQWPAPHQAVGFRAQRWDTGTPHPGGQWGDMLARLIGAASQPKSPPAASRRAYRFVDDARPDPVGEWAYRVAGFDLFGALGKWSAPSNAVGSQRVAAAPYRVRVRRFDNSANSGGAPSAAGDAWVGGALSVDVAWSGASFLNYPDLASARLIAESVNGSPMGEIYSLDLTLRPAAIDPIQIVKVLPNGAEVTLTSVPALPLAADDPPGLLLLYGTPTGSGTQVVDRYAVSASEIDPTQSSVTFSAGASSRLVNNPGAFQGRTAYFVRGYRLLLGDIMKGAALLVPIGVPIAQTTARGRVFVQVSTVTPFDSADQIVDPNSIEPTKPQPPSPAAEFLAQQWLVPQQPPAPNLPIPTHTVHHEYYDPPDYYGNARIKLPGFATPNVAGVSRYHLYRAAVPAVASADVERRLKAGTDITNDGTLSITESGGGQRIDLQAWIASAADWLAAYNARRSANGLPPVAAGGVLGDDDARRAFAEHFYAGLLDDELRALADIPDNIGGFAPARAGYDPAGTPLTDTITALGATRELYKLLAINAAGSRSAHTVSAGPYYSRSVLAPDAPSFLQAVAASAASGTLAWSLTSREDVVGYLVFRADTPDELADLRFFGTDPGHALSRAQTSQVLYQPGQWPPLAWEPGAKPRDPRIIALVPEPRLFARDYDGSDMAEVVLQGGVVPDSILGVYRQSEYDISTLQNQPAAFNYWLPPAKGGITQLIKASATEARITGLRVGLGFSVPVVVVAWSGGTAKALGTLANVNGRAVRMASFTDTAPHATNFYRIVALDVWGNRSDGSSIVGS